MLSSIGSSNPLVVVFVAQCCGIFLWLKDMHSLVFCSLILLCLLSGSRLIHALSGLAIGVVSIYLAPAWTEIKEGEHRVLGVVCSAEYDEGTYRIELDKAQVDGKRIKGHFLLSVYSDVIDLGPGTVVELTAKIRKESGFGNDGEFDYKTFLQSKGIAAKGVAAGPEAVIIKRYVRPHGLKHDVNTALSRCAKPEAEVLKAMLTGDTSGITDSIQDSFNSLGISHLIAISGLNMAIVMFIAYTAVLSIIRIVPPLSVRVDGPLLAQIGAVTGVVMYTLFVGPNIPTLRAGIMACCLISCFFLKRKPLILESLAVAGIIIIAIWPHSLYSASFLLTFGAVLGIVGTARKGEALPEWLMIVIIPVVVAAFTMPIIIYDFGFISAPGILVNIVIVPFFSVAIMPLALAGLVLFPFSEVLSSFMFSMAQDAIGLLFQLGDSIGSLSPIPRPSIYWVFACYAGLIISFFSPKSIFRIMSVLICCIMVAAFPMIRHAMNDSGPLSFDFISVGQGDSIVINKGPKSVLIDAGSAQSGFDVGRHVVAPHLLRRGIDSLDLVIVTHMHPDHSRGIPYILDRFKVREVWLSHPQETNPYYQEIVRIMRKKSIPMKIVGHGDKAKLDDLFIDVLGPMEKAYNRKGKLDENMNSVVVLAGDPCMRGLFMGDSEMFGELILAHLGEDIHAHVLKVAHHGSSRSCLDPFLERVQPHVAVISCGLDNAYGDPSPEALQRLMKRGIKIIRTDLHGEITVTSLLPGFSIKSVRATADNHRLE